MLSPLYSSKFELSFSVLRIVLHKRMPFNAKKASGTERLSYFDSGFCWIIRLFNITTE
jgi:hypothetical protein